MKSFENLLSDAQLRGQRTKTSTRRRGGRTKLRFPATLAASVLAKSDPDPAFDEVDIAFGQPDLANRSGARTGCAGCICPARATTAL